MKAMNDSSQEVAQTNTAAPAKEPRTVKGLFENEDIKRRISDILGKKAATFSTSVVQLVNQTPQLAGCEPVSVINAAMVSATLDLPLNPNLGFAYVIPYYGRDKAGNTIQQAQFQIGYKGIKQLALRTGLFLHLNQTDVRLGEIKNRDRLSGEIEFEWIESEEQRLNTPIIGYVSFFKLQNGFTSTFYMSVEEIEAHALKYSKNYAKYKSGLWATDRKGMSEKTVTKLNLSKNAPLSVDDLNVRNLVQGLQADQAVINDFDNFDEGLEYVDNADEAEFELLPEEEANKMEEEAMRSIKAKKQ